MSWWGALSNVLTGGVAQSLADAYKARNDATTDQARIAADVQIARIEERQKAIAQGGRWITAVQIAWAAPFIVYNFKLIVWDKVLGLGVTDPLSPELLYVEHAVIGFFFGASMLIGGIRAIKR